MKTLNPWINFNGNAEEAFMFYKSILGGELTQIVRFKQLASPEFPVADAEAEKLMQITLQIGDGQMLIGNDVPAFLGKTNERENRSKIHLFIENKEEAENTFAALSVGGEVDAQMGASPWGTYFGMFRDKYGIEWIIECENK